jgi:hypothetical protein
MIDMATPLDDLNARVSELKIDLAFVALATQLRPRLLPVVQWDATADVVELARSFMNSKSWRPEGVYGPLLVRLVAEFERYIRMLIAESVQKSVAGVAKYDDLPEHIARRNIALTGKLLAAIEAPRDHLTFEIDSLIANLASCKRGSGSFRLNELAFSAIITGVSPDLVEKALQNVGVAGNLWDGAGLSVALEKQLGTNGPRETGTRARERLKEICRWRNSLAHGGDEDIALSESDLVEAIDFVTCLSGALDQAVRKQLRVLNG